MWVMSDRAIPRSYRTMEGFGVHTFRLVNAAGRDDAREVPLEAGRRHPRPGVGRGAEARRHRPRLPPPRPLERDRGRQLPAVGPRRPGHPGLRRPDLRGHRPARPDQARARGARPGAARRPDDARPQPDQLLRRDRAGRVPRRQPRAAASTSPTTRCCRPGSSPTSTPSSPGSAARTSTSCRSTARAPTVNDNQRDGFGQQADPRGPRAVRARTRSAAAARSPSATPGVRPRARAASRARRSGCAPQSFDDHFRQAHAVLEQHERARSRTTSSARSPSSSASASPTPCRSACSTDLAEIDADLCAQVAANLGKPAPAGLAARGRRRRRPRSRCSPRRPARSTAAWSACWSATSRTFGRSARWPPALAEDGALMHVVAPNGGSSRRTCRSTRRT